ncbi:RNA recognition motif domain-containing protein [Chryseosolibacter indicus]|uniref:RNA-binding protein n=1 Tax=Chryseosolibacter indicus TaxID=2782351 RepID=A0ABS5VYB5_9BACT|nr:RNA-binding protein [Chryseosolibacter indicus]MBT1705001.1 RNA-binding protein [Chryseosolibacter indicus]
MNIYVGNLDRQATEKELRSLFNQFGEVKSVRIVKDHESGEPRGFAFVEMTDDQLATKAIQELDAKPFANKRLKVNEAKPKKSTVVYNSFASYYGYRDRFKH